MKKPMFDNGKEIKTTGDLRGLMLDAMSALSRGEISATECNAVAKRVNAETTKMRADLAKLKAAL